MYHPRVFHITPTSSVKQLFEKGVYTTDSLFKEKFIHCSTLEQVLLPANNLFKGREDLCLLEIDTDPKVLQSRLVFEDCYEEGICFPHVYGPINACAVRRIHPFPVCPNKGFVLPRTVEDYSSSETIFYFDIDSTLTKGTVNHKKAFTKAFESIFNQSLSLDGVPVHGKTDSKLIEGLLQEANIESNEQLLQTIETELILQYLRLESIEADSVEAFEGAHNLLSSLARKGYPILAVTGNFENIAWNKLRKTQLDAYFTAGTFSSMNSCRIELLRIAKSWFPHAQNHIHFGDAKEDIEAARKNGVYSIGMGTGKYSCQDLLSFGANQCFESLQEAIPFLIQRGIL